VHAEHSPAWNFDVAGYVAAARAPTDAEPRRVRAETYREIAEVAPMGAYAALTSDWEYRRALYAKAEFLETQIPFHRSKLFPSPAFPCWPTASSFTATC